MSRFIFMLTRGDVTVPDARRVFDQVADLAVGYVGFKDIGLPLPELKALASDIRLSGKRAMLEVVSETKDDELNSLDAARDIGVDYVLGGTHAEEGAAILAGSGIRYMPFPGRVVGHPSTLHGTDAEIVESARALSARPGVAGLDLLAYRYMGDAEALIAAVLGAVQVPVVAAGSIDTVERIRAVCRLGVWGFTVGSAVFDASFDGPRHPRGQIETILAASGA